METAALIQVLNAMKTARDASDWRGLFTSEIRNATVEHRLTRIAKPLDDAINELQKELDTRRQKPKHRRKLSPKPLPYKDD